MRDVSPDQGGVSSVGSWLPAAEAPRIVRNFLFFIGTASV
jgi:hypothetical protein